MLAQACRVPTLGYLAQKIQPQRGCVRAQAAGGGRHNPGGVGWYGGGASQGRPIGQPWAFGHNPVGIGSKPVPERGATFGVAPRSLLDLLKNLLRNHLAWF